mmetsp:Transcript_10733/g.19841  ORF Transcript_10733/g.19841 Transcript_10733/m.19841 type:complete len:255 (+) Transcript_10733:67-831(+)
MFRIAISTLPRACTTAAPFLAVGGAALAQFAGSRKDNVFVSCEPRPSFGWDTVTGFFKRKAPDSFAPLVLCGPSGVGKGTIIKALMKEYPDKFGFCVSTTTRGPRPGEVDGKDYHFVGKDVMVKAIEEGKFVEHANVHTNMYGTSIAALEAVKAQNKIVILDIDIQGAKQVKEKLPEVHFVFLTPPSMEVLEKRLRGRGTETEEKVAKRLKNAVGEIEFSKTPGFWDHVVVADESFTEALPKMRVILKGWYPQL